MRDMASGAPPSSTSGRGIPGMPPGMTVDQITIQMARMLVQQGRESILVPVLNARPDLLFEEDHEGWTLLHWAAINGDLRMVDLMLTKGANPLHGDKDLGQCALYWAVAEGNVPCIHKLLSVCAAEAVNFQDKSGHSLAMVAVQKGNLEALHYLSVVGADLDHLDLERHSMLHWAAHKNHRDMVSYLVARGSSIDISDHIGRTPLHYAARGGKAGAAKGLLKAGSSLTSKDEDGKTPWDLAKAVDPDSPKTVNPTAVLIEGRARSDKIRASLVPVQALTGRNAQGVYTLLTLLAVLAIFSVTPFWYTPLAVVGSALVALNSKFWIAFLGKTMAPLKPGTRQVISFSRPVGPVAFLSSFFAVCCVTLVALALPSSSTSGLLPDGGLDRVYSNSGPLVGVCVTSVLWWAMFLSLVFSDPGAVKRHHVPHQAGKDTNSVDIHKNQEQLPVRDMEEVFTKSLAGSAAPVGISNAPEGVDSGSEEEGSEPSVALVSPRSSAVPKWTTPELTALDQVERKSELEEFVTSMGPAAAYSPQFCIPCAMPKSVYSYHCKACNRCVHKFDHCCPWIANDVGGSNLPRFFAWLLLSFGIVIAGMVHTVRWLDSVHGAYDSYRAFYNSSWTVRLVIIVVCLGVFFVLFTAALIFTQLNNIKGGSTSVLLSRKLVRVYPSTSFLGRCGDFWKLCKTDSVVGCSSKKQFKTVFEDRKITEAPPSREVMAMQASRQKSSCGGSCSHGKKNEIPHGSGGCSHSHAHSHSHHDNGAPASAPNPTGEVSEASAAEARV